jgi:hypothetical protein
MPSELTSRRRNALLSTSMFAGWPGRRTDMIGMMAGASPPQTETPPLIVCLSISRVPTLASCEGMISRLISLTLCRIRLGSRTPANSRLISTTAAKRVRS